MANLIFHTAFVGDLLLAIPLLRHLKRAEPNRRLILVCRPHLGEFFLKNGLVDDVFELDKKRADSIAKFYAFMAGIEVDKIFCVHESFRSAWMLRKIPAKQKIGYTRFWNRPFFDTRVDRPMHLPEALRALYILTPFDSALKKRLDSFATRDQLKLPRTSVAEWPYTIDDDLSLLTPVSSDRMQALTTKLSVRTPYAVLAPSSQWNTKRWTEEGFVETARRLHAQGMNVYMIGTGGEKAHCDRVAESARLGAASNVTSDTEGFRDGVVPIRSQSASTSESTLTSVSTSAVTSPSASTTASTSKTAPPAIRSLAGQTSLYELHALLAGAEIVITNDSGPMHMATAAGAPVVAIFGPTTLDLGYRPWSDRARVEQIDLPCRPCGKHGHDKCPIGTHACMRDLSAERVFGTVQEMRK